MVTFIDPGNGISLLEADALYLRRLVWLGARKKRSVRHYLRGNTVTVIASYTSDSTVASIRRQCKLEALLQWRRRLVEKASKRCLSKFTVKWNFTIFTPTTYRLSLLTVRGMFTVVSCESLLKKMRALDPWETRRIKSRRKL